MKHKKERKTGIKAVKSIAGRKFKAFIRGERGRISKHSLLTMGAIVGTAAVAALLSAKNVESGPIVLTKTITDKIATIRGEVAHGGY
ncbi:hypothetical protein HYU15_00500 [Candidatus Woesearchaeota archaeon]|nr:hypothetical protein [Candidatus Woesearchaeota archaeon]